jgi:hypothetical protein
VAWVLVGARLLAEAIKAKTLVLVAVFALVLRVDKCPCLERFPSEGLLMLVLRSITPL